MADINARTRHLIATTADWQANDLVLGLGEIGFEIQADGTIVSKVGDGVATFTALGTDTAWTLQPGTATAQVPRWNDINNKWEPVDQLLVRLADVRINDVPLQMYDSVVGTFNFSAQDFSGTSSLRFTPLQSPSAFVFEDATVRYRNQTISLNVHFDLVDNAGTLEYSWAPQENSSVFVLEAKDAAGTSYKLTADLSGNLLWNGNIIADLNGPLP